MNNSPIAVRVCAVLCLTIAACGGSPPPAPEAPKAPPPTTEVPAPKPPTPEPVASTAPVPDKPAVENKTPEPPPTKTDPPIEVKAVTSAAIEGTLVSRVGKVITIKGTGEAKAGAKGTLSKHFEQQFGPIAASGWLTIAEVTVKEVKGDTIVLNLDAEQSTIVKNGKKVDHFTKGNRVKLELKP